MGEINKRKFVLLKDTNYAYKDAIIEEVGSVNYQYSDCYRVIKGVQKSLSAPFRSIKCFIDPIVITKTDEVKEIFKCEKCSLDTFNTAKPDPVVSKEYDEINMIVLCDDCYAERADFI